MEKQYSFGQKSDTDQQGASFAPCDLYQIQEKERKNMISLYCVWYGRHEDMSPDYSDAHHGTIHGKTPSDCMSQLRVFQENHDLSKYTHIEIILVY